MNRLLVGTALLLLSGCATQYGKRAPGGVVGKLSYEGRVWLLDSERELAIVQERVNEAVSDVGHATEDRDAAERRLSKVAGEVEQIDKDTDGPTLAVREAKAQVVWALAQEQAALARREVEQFALTCARARYELAIVEIAKKVKGEDAEALSPDELADQADRCNDELLERRAKLRELEDKPRLARSEWDRRRSALARKNKLIRPGPYVELDGP
jgi:chromosome segregation ATPase